MANQLKILIVEDDFMIADMAEEFLVAHGFDVCGITGTVDGAVALGRLHRPDLAMIDYRLAGGGLGTQVAARLLAFGDIGILYATGNNSTDALKDALGEASIGKPYRSDDLVRALAIVADIKAFGASVRPFPHGFQLLKTALRKQTELADA